jgi:DNA-directed RNA polymerase specialized sigma subunit
VTVAAKRGGGDPFTDDEHRLVREALALPAAQRFVTRLARRCPVLTDKEVNALAEDAMLAKVRTFDDTRGVSLFAYAKKNIEGRIVRAAGRRGEHTLWMEAMGLVSDTLDELPLSELATATGEDINRQLRQMGATAGAAVRYGLACSDDTHLTPEVRLLNSELREALARAMSQEGTDVTALIKAIFFGDETWETAADAQGISKSKAYRLLRAAFERMRARLAAWDTEKK